MGKLVGRYFNKDGSATEYSKKYEKWLMEAKAESAANDAEKQIFPPCNSEWSQVWTHVFMIFFKYFD